MLVYLEYLTDQNLNSQIKHIMTSWQAAALISNILASVLFNQKIFSAIISRSDNDAINSNRY